MTVAMAPAPSEELRTTLPHTLSEVGLLLREDDSLLRQTFFGIVKHHHPTLADKIDTIYALSLAWCRTESDRDFQQLEKCLAELNPDELILVRGRGPRSLCACALGQAVVTDRRSTDVRSKAHGALAARTAARLRASGSALLCVHEADP